MPTCPQTFEKYYFLPSGRWHQSLLNRFKRPSWAAESARINVITSSAPATEPRHTGQCVIRRKRKGIASLTGRADSVLQGRCARNRHCSFGSTTPNMGVSAQVEGCACGSYKRWIPPRFTALHGEAWCPSSVQPWCLHVRECMNAMVIKLTNAGAVNLWVRIGSLGVVVVRHP